ncbi:uncharacterized protein DS421_2g42520 [Arachis hypogaea]|nr:uncharacterized protein DS421_2g42520 [Arachis hypogaea]
MVIHSRMMAVQEKSDRLIEGTENPGSDLCTDRKPWRRKLEKGEWEEREGLRCAEPPPTCHARPSPSPCETAAAPTRSQRRRRPYRVAPLRQSTRPCHRQGKASAATMSRLAAVPRASPPSSLQAWRKLFSATAAREADATHPVPSRRRTKRGSGRRRCRGAARPPSHPRAQREGDARKGTFFRRCRAVSADSVVAVAAAWVPLVQAAIDGARITVSHGRCASGHRETPPLLPPETATEAGELSQVAAAGITAETAASWFSHFLFAVSVYVPVTPLIAVLWLKAEVSVAGDFELRRKGLCETFGLWICVLR